MKKIATLIFILMSCFVYSQTSQDLYSYKIKLQGVTNPEEAKAATDYIRVMFKTNPVFNDSLDCFEFNSYVGVVENGFRYYIQDTGYQLISFTKEVAKKTEHTGQQVIYKEEGDN